MMKVAMSVATTINSSSNGVQLNKIMEAQSELNPE